jgi:hypothetical protein
MSDFSELCPLFNTGVFNEVTFPNLNGGTGVFATYLTYNMLEGAGASAALKLTAGTGHQMFTFGRTVIVTDAYIQRTRTNKTAQNLILQHKTSAAAAGTGFGSVSITITLSVYTTTSWQKFHTCTDTTFTSSEVLGLVIGTITGDTIGTYNLLIQYKEA